MALLATEAFDTGNSNQTLYVFNNARSNTTGGVYDTGCLFFPATNATFNSWAYKVFRPVSNATANSYLNLSFWIKVAAPPQQHYKFMYLEDTRSSTGQQGLGLGLNTDGRIVLWRNRGSVTDTTWGPWKYSSYPPLSDNKWHFIELNTYSVNNNNTYVYIWRDNRLEMTYFGNLDSLFSGYLRWEQVVFNNLYGTNGCHYWIDDLVVWDQSGSNYNTFPKGPTRIQTLRPTADISSLNATSTGATNYEVLDEENTIDTSDYVTLSNTSNIVLEMSNLINETANVYGFITTALINSGQGGVSNIKIGNKIDSTYAYTGAQTYFTLTYLPSQLITETNFAAGGSLLSTQNVNDLVVSVDRTV